MAERSPRRRGTEDGVRVWCEAGVTLAVTDNPPQFVRFTVGMERMSPRGDADSVARTERALYRQCEKAVEARSRELVRLVRRTARER